MIRKIAKERVSEEVKLKVSEKSSYYVKDYTFILEINYDFLLSLRCYYIILHTKFWNIIKKKCNYFRCDICKRVKIICEYYLNKISIVFYLFILKLWIFFNYTL